MASSDEPTVKSVQLLAGQAGLALTEKEAADLVNGVQRNKGFAVVVRQLLSPDLEPSPIFSASPPLGGLEQHDG